jgi:hypothetical protein
MNPRRIHELMLARFPDYRAVDHEWINVCPGSGADENIVASVLQKYFESPEVLIEVRRKVGAFLPLGQAISYIATHVGKGEIRVADRDFCSFAVFASNGVATGWRVGA